VVGDAKAEIVVGSGMRNASRVRVFTGEGERLPYEIEVFDNQYLGGVDVAVGQVRAGGKDEIVVVPHGDRDSLVGVYALSGPMVDSTISLLHRIERLFPYLSRELQELLVRHFFVQAQSQSFSGESFENEEFAQMIASFFAFEEGYRGGLNVAVGDTNKNGVDEIVVGKAKGGASEIRVYDMSGRDQDVVIYPYDKQFEGGAHIAVGDLDGGLVGEIATLPALVHDQASRADQKYLDINLSEQRLRAYEQGILLHSFLISSGSSFPTRAGEFSISQKVYNKHYYGYYGPGSSLNFDLPNVLYNLRFDGPRLLHGAYWHNNFGTPMSHGCINMPVHEAKWVYEWADLGDAVSVHY
jgi:hypothetical protein